MKTYSLKNKFIIKADSQCFQHKSDDEDCWIEEFYTVLEPACINILKDAPHYLLIAHNWRKDNTSEHVFVHSKEEIFTRAEETLIVPLLASYDKRFLLCKEKTAKNAIKTSTIALSEEEYEKLKDEDWNGISIFLKELKGEQ